MTDEKGLVDAYSSMYEEAENPEEIKEIAVTGTIAAVKGAMALAKGAKLAKGLSTAANVAGKVSQVADAAGAVGDAANKIRGKGQKHPDNQQEEVEFSEGKNPKKKKNDRKKEDIAIEKKLGLPKRKAPTADYPWDDRYEEVEGGVSVVDYNSDYTPTEIETVDLMPLPKMKGTEDLQEDDAELESRLWDQVAANLTTLGEMAGVKYKVSPLEEKKDDDKKEDDDDDKDDDKKKDKKKDKTKNKDEKWQDSDGDGKWYEKGEDVKEGFNVKSPLTFSKKEEVSQVTPTELEEKYACSIKKAHKAIKK